jgi:hypothetical protein
LSKETAEAFGIILDRLTRPTVTLMFATSICWMGVRTVHNISADQFVAIVMAVVLFWFGSRPTTASTTNGATATTTTDPAGSTTTTAVAKPGG